MYQQLINLLFPRKRTKSIPLDMLDLNESSEKSQKKELNFISFLKSNATLSGVQNNIFRVQNILNEIYGLVEPLVQKNKIEFLYDIDKSVPIELVGNPLVLEQMLYNLLYSLMQDSYNSTIILQLKKENSKLIFNVKSRYFKSKDEIRHDIFYIDFTQLLEKIEGELSVVTQGLDTIHTITLPFLSHELYQETYFQLPSSIDTKKILLIEDHPDTRIIFNKIFTQFNLDISIEDSDKLPSINNFEIYDMLILDAKKITPILMRHLQELKESYGLIIISLETLYGWHQDRRLKPNALIHKYLYRPLSRGMVSGLLHEMFVLKTDKTISIDEHTNEERFQRTGKIVCIEETVNINRENFKDFGKKHILVVEDNLINQKIMQSILEKSNIQITLANDGQEALNFLNSNSSIDLVIMDINMPIMDGYQATKHIRKNEVLKNLPIVIISGLGFRNEIEQMYLVGADAHLTKPFKIGELYTVFKMFTAKKYHQENTVETPSLIYKENKELLNTTKGIAKMHNILIYRDTLREMLVKLNYSNIIIKEHIIRKEGEKLKEYCKQILLDTKAVEAKSLTHILEEILILLTNNEEELLQQYITLYHDEWIKSKRNIERYLKSVDAY